MRPPDPTKPVLYEGTPSLFRYRYGIPLLVIAIMSFIGWSLPAGVRGHIAYLLLPGAVILAWAVFYGLKLRSASVTEEGIIVPQHGPEFLLEWSDIDWATEIWMNPPTLVVRLRPGLPAVPHWFLIIPPRGRRFGWSAQPMSKFVSERVREARAAHPEQALTYSAWPSRAVLTLKVQGATTLAMLAALALSIWLSIGAIRDWIKEERNSDPPITASADPIAALTPARRNT